MKLYAIKHLPSGGFLPAKIKCRGNSFTEPTKDEPPRLYTDMRSARCALSAWLRGEWIPHTSQHYEDPYSETYYAPQKVESRKKEEMAVVEVFIKEL